MRAHLQHPAIAQMLLAGQHRRALLRAAVGREQLQFAVFHHLVERAVGFNRRQPGQFQEAAVPDFQRALVIHHRHALRQAVDGALQQPGLLLQRLLAPRLLGLLEVGDIGVHDHQPAFAGRPFADLHPALVTQLVQQMAVGGGVSIDDQPGAQRHALDLTQRGTLGDTHVGALPERGKAAVVEHDALVLVEQHEGIGHAFDGVDQVVVGFLGAGAGIAQQAVAGLQLGHGVVQRLGAFAHLFSQLHRVLKRRVAFGALTGAGFDPLDQRGVDAFEFAVFRAQGFQLGQQLRIMQRQLNGGMQRPPR